MTITRQVLTLLSLLQSQLYNLYMNAKLINYYKFYGAMVAISKVKKEHGQKIKNLCTFIRDDIVNRSRILHG